MKRSELDFANKWFQVAEDDLKSASDLLKSGIYRNVCFLSQQAVEKSLKGLLAYLGIEFAKTHKLIELFRLLTKHGMILDIEENDLKQLDAYYIEPRYPNAHFEIYEKEEAGQALKIAKAIIEKIKDRLDLRCNI